MLEKLSKLREKILYLYPGQYPKKYNIDNKDILRDIDLEYYELKDITFNEILYLDLKSHDFNIIDILWLYIQIKTNKLTTYGHLHETDAISEADKYYLSVNIDYETFDKFNMFNSHDYLKTAYLLLGEELTHKFFRHKSIKLYNFKNFSLSEIVEFLVKFPYILIHQYSSDINLKTVFEGMLEFKWKDVLKEFHKYSEAELIETCNMLEFKNSDWQFSLYDRNMGDHRNRILQTFSELKIKRYPNLHAKLKQYLKNMVSKRFENGGEMLLNNLQRMIDDINVPGYFMNLRDYLGLNLYTGFFDIIELEEIYKLHINLIENYIK